MTYKSSINTIIVIMKLLFFGILLLFGMTYILWRIAKKMNMEGCFAFVGVLVFVIIIILAIL